MEPEEFLDEDLLLKLERLKLLADRVRKGPHKGEHESWRSGTSLEFQDYRKYQVGDDFRYVDWNVYGRLDKLFLKLFRSEENLKVHILVDISRSMAFGMPSKAWTAKRLAAALSYLTLSNLDRVEFFSFADSLKESLGSQRGKKAYLSIRHYLKGLIPKGETALNNSLVDFASSKSLPGLAIIISDLLDPQGYVKGLETLVQRKFKTVLIQVMDHEELFPSLDGYLILKEMETGETKKITLDGELRSLYRKKMEHFLEGIKDFCLSKKIEYFLLDTSLPFEDLLFEVLGGGTIFR